ncbi:MAG: biotin transporter BioY [Candidatus Ranarchaeia archaeon]
MSKFLSPITRRSVRWSLAAVCACLLAVSSWFVVPFWPVPITFQTVLLFTVALSLGSNVGLGMVVVYWGLGIMGLPVFAGGTAGFHRFLGPTGGYLMGFLPAVLVSAYFGRLRQTDAATKRSILVYARGLFLGHFALYLCGLTWLWLWLGFNWIATIVSGLLLFIPGDIVKGAVILILVTQISPYLNGLINEPSRVAH